MRHFYAFSRHLFTKHGTAVTCVKTVTHCLSETSHLGHIDTAATGAFVDYQRFTELARVMHSYRHFINT